MTTNRASSRDIDEYLRHFSHYARPGTLNVICNECFDGDYVLQLFTEHARMIQGTDRAVLYLSECHSQRQLFRKASMRLAKLDGIGQRPMQSLPFFTLSSKAAFCCLDVVSIVERYSLSGFIPEVVVLECCQRDSDPIALEETIKQWLAVAMYCNVTVWVSYPMHGAEGLETIAKWANTVATMQVVHTPHEAVMRLRNERLHFCGSLALEHDAKTCRVKERFQWGKQCV